MIGTRGQVFLLSVVVVLLVVLASGLWLARSLQTLIGSELQAGLQRDAAEAVLVVQGSADLGATARAIGDATGARVVIEAGDGRVIADSDAADGDPGALVARATFHRPDGDGDVRLLLPSRRFDEATLSVRVLVTIAQIFGLGVALVSSAITSEIVARRLRDLAGRVRARVSRGRPDLERSTVDEVLGLSGSFDKLALDLDQTVGALTAERDRFGALLEGMSEGVFSVDKSGCIGLVNSAALSMLERDGIDPRGGPVTLLTRNPQLIEIVDAARAGEDAAGEIEMPPRALLARARPAAGGCVVVLFDATDLRRLERVRRDFVANVSHELRTPVAIVLANAETLQDGALGDPTAGPRFVEAIRRTAERLTRLINDLLDLSRIEAGRYPLDPQPVNASAAARHAVDAIRGRARNHLLDVQVDPRLVVQADPKALDQVLVNLVDNAVKYTPPGGTILVRGAESGNRATLSVVDDGPGIPPEHRERIFERFYRVDPGRSRDMGGTGLGLAIVRHLTEQMGGRASVRANEPRGAIFDIELPKGAVGS